ncbi:hypothetical protein G6O67_004886 [Ophiocordyceps sinensis]|uniref:Uncharacterized protein n=1 Tax=Ophiocordyceps sinensis TaxID=72228 RepID=A0A8H4V5I1_9HYPO|nr:hypothetical protein G6O67_004886 [Ophiocordyceps sinensis]
MIPSRAASESCSKAQLDEEHGEDAGWLTWKAAAVGDIFFIPSCTTDFSVTLSRSGQSTTNHPPGQRIQKESLHLHHICMSSKENDPYEGPWGYRLFWSPRTMAASPTTE